ncbi:MAG TPA: PIN domain-containing protein [Phycisphaerae bacterium]|nr:PIN domain-containing protein [Phycisphaerae bacterium]
MIFADTHFFVAFLNERDADHQRALDASRSIRGPILTTEYVLIETANALAAVAFRTRFADFARLLQTNSSIDMVWSTRALLSAGLALYSSRPDKDWSLTDCISFTVIKQKRISQALTHDHHFTQAGFRTLL